MVVAAIVPRKNCARRTGFRLTRTPRHDAWTLDYHGPALAAPPVPCLGPLPTLSRLPTPRIAEPYQPASLASRFGDSFRKDVESGEDSWIATASSKWGCHLRRPEVTVQITAVAHISIRSCTPRIGGTSGSELDTPMRGECSRPDVCQLCTCWSDMRSPFVWRCSDPNRASSQHRLWLQINHMCCCYSLEADCWPDSSLWGLPRLRETIGLSRVVSNEELGDE